MNKDLDNRVTDKRLKGVYGKLMQVLETKHIRTLVLVFIAGIIITLIPTLLYISSLKDNNLPALQYVPNNIAYRIPSYVQLVKTQEQVNKIKQYNIRDNALVSVGAVVKLVAGLNSLSIIPAEEITAPSYHIKDIGIQKEKIRFIDGYEFIPDGYFTKDPIALQILTTESEVEMAKKRKNLNNKDLLEIGAAVTCPSAICFVTAKGTLEKEYEKVVPISEL